MKQTFVDVEGRYYYILCIQIDVINKKIQQHYINSKKVWTYLSDTQTIVTD